MWWMVVDYAVMNETVEQTTMVVIRIPAPQPYLPYYYN